MATQEGELSFEPGDRIFVVKKDPRLKMWQGVLAGKVGTFPAVLVQEFDQEARAADAEAMKAAVAASGKQVETTKCKVVEPHESKGAGEISLAVGDTVILPNEEEFESPHSPGVVMYRGVAKGEVGLFPADCVEEHDEAEL